MDEQFVSIGMAAKMLGMSIDGLRKWERGGRLIPVRTVTSPWTTPRTFIGAIGS